MFYIDFHVETFFFLFKNFVHLFLKITFYKISLNILKKERKKKLYLKDRKIKLLKTCFLSISSSYSKSGTFLLILRHHRSHFGYCLI